MTPKDHFIKSNLSSEVIQHIKDHGTISHCHKQPARTGFGGIASRKPYCGDAGGEMVSTNPPGMFSQL